MAGKILNFIFLIFFCSDFCSAWATVSYSREVVCQFNPSDVTINLNDPFFRFDVDEKEDIYFLDETNEIKVFDHSGKLVKKIQWPRNINRSWELLARNGFLFIYSEYDAYALNLSGGNWEELSSSSYLEGLTLIDGQVFDFMHGKVLFSLNKKNEKVSIPAFYKNYLLKNVFVISALDGSRQTAEDYGGYKLMGVESIEKNGDVFGIYGKPYETDDENGQPTIVQYKWNLYEFDKNLNIVNVWNNFNLRVNETTNNVYELGGENNIWQLIRWRKIN